MMNAEAIQKILDVAAPSTVHLDPDDGLKFSNKQLDVIAPPEVKPVQIGTLQGLWDLYDADFDTLKESDPIVHVLTPWTVKLQAKDSDKYGRFREFAVATNQKTAVFPFGKFMSPEEFIIQAHVCFQRVAIEKDDGTMAKDLDYILKIASAISAGQERTNEDDGISQVVQVKAGVTLKKEEPLRGIVSLAPFRTFAEIDQVISRFLFRARGGYSRDGEDATEPQLALFEADGGRWKLDAVEAIADWLEEKFHSVDVAVIS